MLEDQRAYFDYRDITDAAEAVRDKVDAAYELMCEAGHLDGLAVEEGVTLDDLRRLSGLHRAGIVDAELTGMRPQPRPDAPVWTVDIGEHGGFIATGTSQRNVDAPWKFWGIAATPASAAHALAWYFLDQPPQIMFDPPISAQPCARTTWDADRSPEGPSVRDLLDRRGPIYRQHLDAALATREVLRSRADDLRAWLSERATHLNATDPQRLLHSNVLNTPTLGVNRDHLGFVHTVTWVPTPLVVRTDHPIWGDFGGFRDDVPSQIATALLRSDDLDTLTGELFGDEISLILAPGWAGPIYQIGSNGNHRIHTARLLNLPWLAAAVEIQALPPVWSMHGLLAADPDDENQLRRPLDHRIRERIELITGLLRRGIIDGDLEGDTQDPVLRCRRVPAAWLLRSAEHATAVNVVYESRYPGALAQLSIPLVAGTDPAAWQAWLTGT
ncbi:MAG TPA: hypothetical protein VFG15_03485 [Amycolatopsis sp.]|nr:hypothetical protein [Amycolatopsis sp.]